MAQEITLKLKKRSGIGRLWHRNKYALLFLTPWILGLLIFSIYPIIYSLYLSFTNFNLIQTPDWIGIRNYRFLLRDPRFLQASKVTLRYVLYGVPLQLVFALALALVLNKGIPGLKFFRAVYYLPALLGGSVAIAILWRQVFGIEGIINQLLAFLSLPETITGISWITNPRYSLSTLIILRAWQFGSPMIIFLAALKQIPQELYESAETDGANGMVRFWRITLPMISPIILFNIIMQMISAFQSFTPAYIIGGVTGGALDSLLFYTLYLYNMGFSFFRMGIASAMAWFMMIAISVLTIIIFRISARAVHYAD